MLMEHTLIAFYQLFHIHIHVHMFQLLLNVAAAFSQEAESPDKGSLEHPSPDLGIQSLPKGEAAKAAW